MKKNEFSEESSDVLSLGYKHEQIQKEKAKKKMIVIPIVLILIGICFILAGIFFNDIKKILNIDDTQKEEIKKVDDGIIILTCQYSKDDTTLGLSRKQIVKYEFKDNLLKKISTTVSITILENSYDIGINNIKIYYQKYNDFFKDIKLDGLEITTTYKNEKLKNVVSADLEVLDVAKIPNNNYISITNKKDQSYREIKEIEGKAGHICKIS